ncbi:MAG: ABC transporter permease [Verrucomicrobiales bacterium]|nr:ABC transporter permease [Verrucomicrobiales bacterium]
MPFSLFLALRYLKPKRTFVSVITLLSVVGVSFGVAVLIVVISVMAGFQKRIKEQLLAVEPHIIMNYRGPVEDADGFPVDNEWEEVMERVKAVPGVLDASPLIEGTMVMAHGDDVSPTYMRAIEPEGDAFLGRGEDLEMVEGEFDLSGDGVVLSYMLASAEGIEIGDKLTLYSEKSMREVAKVVREMERDPDSENLQEKFEGVKEGVLPIEVTVKGMVAASKDGYYVLMPLTTAQELMELGDTALGVTVKVENPYEVHGKAEEIWWAAGERVDWQPVTWTDRHKGVVQAVQMERVMMYFVLFGIMVVAAFCIMNTMITVTVQKRQEIGVIGAIGAKVSQVVWVFLMQGMVVGLTGVTSGLTMGLLVLHYRESFRSFIGWVTGFEILDPKVYGSAAVQIPAFTQTYDVAMICGVSFLMCALAALVPAYFAARIDPAKALRNVGS